MKGHIVNSVSPQLEAQYEGARASNGQMYAVGLVTAAAVAAAFGLSMVLPANDAGAGPASIKSAPAPEPYHLIVETLLAPAIQVGAVPLRWMDSRAALR